MASDLRPGPNDPPADELAAAEAAWAVLEQVLSGITSDQWSNPTPCSEFDVAHLTEHLLRSITLLGGVAGAQFGPGEPGEALAARVGSKARPTLDAWQRRGLDVTVSIGEHELPARVAAGILSVEFLVHAWDYAQATGRSVDAGEPLAQYVLDLARAIITPEGRVQAGFDEPVAVADSEPALRRLLAFTGRS
ncbi:TIGR03086 family metal-binding protein [Mycolicibacter hiberniae]|uniref:TIGR03086 family protein n=1 Tax=Mycolicibacter hiberniae TaxID=29314 RepID=A0A7I7X749_9MYCO|nr:TIGR03086 family metal-binding protein [Mycolicibacter hiberniae]MCV7085016.1 TIGR03086 family protein [Mycolicibacter hiberniae]ORV68656.1 ArsR family transcriptional regulator [Mycolicibacter hiberniae]BBZ25302.1 TIGR03086 family protein [Mycolicibacter hiberniae]